MEVFYVVFISLFGRGKQNTLYIADRNLLELLIVQFCMKVKGQGNRYRQTLLLTRDDVDSMT